MLKNYHDRICMVVSANYFALGSDLLTSFNHILIQTDKFTKHLHPVHSLYEFCYRSYIQRECHSVLAKLHPITFYRIISGECAVPGLNATFCFLWFTNCVLLFDKNLNTRMLVTFGICFKQHCDTRYLVFYNTSPPRMFLSLDLL